VCSLGYHLQFLSPTTTRLFSRHQLTHVLRGGIAIIPSLSSPLNFIFLADGGSIHLNFNEVKPIDSRNAPRSRVATSHRCFCISAKMFHLNFNKIRPISTRNTRSRVATSHRCFCISSTAISLSSSASPRSGCAQVQCPCSSHWGSVCVLWATTLAFCLERVSMFFGRPPSRFLANNETLQQASAHPCSSGLDRAQPFLPSLSPL
jgi:hypothetical protein